MQPSTDDTVDTDNTVDTRPSASTTTPATAPAPTKPTPVTPRLLREWPLPPIADSKYGRGQVVVAGGAFRSPGAAMLSGVAALRIGAGRLTVAVARSVAAQVAVAVPECGVVPLDETPDAHVVGASIQLAAKDLADVDAVLVGPGLDDADEAERMLEALPALISDTSVVILDAFALGVLPNVEAVSRALAGRLVLTPNKSEAGRLLGRDLADDSVGDNGGDNVGNAADPVADIREIARRYDAVVSCFGTIAAPDGRAWQVGTGSGGLATSGSGDVLAGAVAGLVARGADLTQAAVWATHAHAVAGDRLAVSVGPLGFLASELLAELPRVLVEVGA